MRPGRPAADGNRPFAGHGCFAHNQSDGTELKADCEPGGGGQQSRSDKTAKHQQPAANRSAGHWPRDGHLPSKVGPANASLPPRFPRRVRECETEPPNGPTGDSVITKGRLVLPDRVCCRSSCCCYCCRAVSSHRPRRDHRAAAAPPRVLLPRRRGGRAPAGVASNRTGGRLGELLIAPS